MTTICTVATGLGFAPIEDITLLASFMLLDDAVQYAELYKRIITENTGRVKDWAQSVDEHSNLCFYELSLKGEHPTELHFIKIFTTRLLTVNKRFVENPYKPKFDYE